MKFLGLWLIRAYQRCISPLLPPACKYSPSCSHFTYQAIERHGFFTGVWLGCGRLCRCNPWSHGGADPAPQSVRWTWHGPVRKEPAPQYDFGLCHCQGDSVTPAAANDAVVPVITLHRVEPVVHASPLPSHPLTHQSATL